MVENLQDAYTFYQQALYHLPNPKEPKLWYGIGILYDRYGYKEYAEEVFSEVMRISPDFEKANEIHYRLGIIYKQQQRFAKSLDCFRQIVNDPPSPLTEQDIWYQIGHSHEEQKEVGVALFVKQPSSFSCSPQLETCALTNNYSMTLRKVLISGFLIAIQTMQRFYSTLVYCIIDRAAIPRFRSKPLNTWKGPSELIRITHKAGTSWVDPTSRILITPRRTKLISRPFFVMPIIQSSGVQLAFYTTKSISSTMLLTPTHALCTSIPTSRKLGSISGPSMSRVTTRSTML